MPYFQPLVIYRNPKDNREHSIIRYIGNRILKQNKNFLCALVGTGGMGKCQPAGNKVLMADGSWKNIEDIKVGDIVLSPQKNGKNFFAVVKKTTSWFCDDVYQVKELNRNKEKLYSCSGNHIIPFFHRF